MLPDLPRLLHDYLRREPADGRRELEALLEEQRRTNRLLQAFLYGGIGFTLGLLAMQLLVRASLPAASDARRLGSAHSPALPCGPGLGMLRPAAQCHMPPQAADGCTTTSDPC